MFRNLLGKMLHGLFVLSWFNTGTSASALPESKPPALEDLSRYNETWTTLGKSSADSMPLGNGDIGINVWTEANGDILFYLSKTDAWTEAPNRTLGLAKVGRVRLSLSPNPFLGKGFRHTLKLREGEIEIRGGEGDQATTVRIWVDAHHPVVRVETESAPSISATVRLDPWRTAAEGFGQPQPKDPTLTESYVWQNDGREQISPDVVLPLEKGRLTWYHHNEKTSEAAVRNLTFGGTIVAEGWMAHPDGGNALQTPQPANKFQFNVVLLSSITETVDTWVGQLNKTASEIAALDRETSRAAHLAWWKAFWSRSWIYLEGDPDAQKVTRGYILQRFVTACAGRGAYPIKFNGSIFTVDNPRLSKGKDKATGIETFAPVTADYRAWGGQYWFQNTRPMYWPRLMSGDYDLMQPLFRMYAQVVKNNAASVRQFYQHDGSYMAETAPFWGGIPNIKPNEAGSYTKHYFTPVLELGAMMLDYYAYTGDEKFVRETLLPMVNAGLTFFSQHFPRDARGTLLLEPNNSIEMYWAVRNPLPDIAGLHWVLARLRELPEELTDADMRAAWKKLASELPPIPVGEKAGKKMLLPAEEGQELKPHNSENPELYAVYPFRHYGLGKPDLDLALNAFDVRLHKRSGCWHQDPVQSAYLGLTDVAKAGVTKCLTSGDKRLRFPAFWEKGHDYEPDQDNGGNGEHGLQLMLMQCEGKTIRLLPSWPKTWNARFKLRAPLDTTVEGDVRDGQLVALKVSPPSRSADVILPKN